MKFFMKNFYNIKREFILNFLIILIPISLLVSPAINTILIVITFIATLLLIIKKSKPISNKKIKFLLLIAVCSYSFFLLMNLTGLTYSDNIAYGFSILRKRFPLFLIPFIVMVNGPSINFKKVLTIFAYTAVAACLYTNIHSIIEILYYQKPLSDFIFVNIRFEYEYLMLYHIHPPYFGLILNIAIAIVLQENTAFISNYKLRVILITILIINQFLVSSQMALLTMLITFSIVLILKLRHNFTILFKAVLVVLIISLLIFISLIFVQPAVTNNQALKNKNNLFFNRIDKLMTEGDLTRIRNWESGLKVFQNNIIFGSGTGDPIEEALNYRDKNTWLYIQKPNFHNQYVEEIARLGLIGFIPFLMFLLISIYEALKRKFTFAVLITTIFLLAMMSESILNRHIGIVLFATFFSILFYLYTYSNAHQKQLSD